MPEKICKALHPVVYSDGWQEEAHLMEPERWREVDRLCHSALALDVSQRTAFLEVACAGDETPKREVESLLKT